MAEISGIDSVPVDLVEVKRHLSCDTCGSREGRYCCPGCHTRSCSVLCVKRHKEDTGCTGKRSKTQYIPLSQYNDSTLLSDYFFLENAIRFVDSTSRDQIKRANHQSIKKTRNMSRLKDVAKSKGVTLFLAPVGLTLHKTNTSYVWFNHKNKVQTIHWKVVWNFVDCDVKYIDRSLSEKILLRDLLAKYICPTNPIIRHRLRPYVSASSSDVKVFMKVEKVKGKRLYYELDKEISFEVNLKGKLIIEHPIVWVTCSTEKALLFPVISTDSQHLIMETNEDIVLPTVSSDGTIPNNNLTDQGNSEVNSDQSTTGQVNSDQVYSDQANINEAVISNTVRESVLINEGTQSECTCNSGQYNGEQLMERNELEDEKLDQSLDDKGQLLDDKGQYVSDKGQYLGDKGQLDVEGQYLDSKVSALDMIAMYTNND